MFCYCSSLCNMKFVRTQLIPPGNKTRFPFCLLVVRSDANANVEQTWFLLKWFKCIYIQEVEHEYSLCLTSVLLLLLHNSKITNRMRNDPECSCSRIRKTIIRQYSYLFCGFKRWRTFSTAFSFILSWGLRSITPRRSKRVGGNLVSPGGWKKKWNSEQWHRSTRNLLFVMYFMKHVPPEKKKWTKKASNCSIWNSKCELVAEPHLKIISFRRRMQFDAVPH